MRHFSMKQILATNCHIIKFLICPFNIWWFLCVCRIHEYDMNLKKNTLSGNHEGEIELPWKTLSNLSSSQMITSLLENFFEMKKFNGEPMWNKHLLVLAVLKTISINLPDVYPKKQLFFETVIPTYPSYPITKVFRIFDAD